ncbi:RNA-directed DNA polymerase [Synechocystis salina LEGE 06155]|nr:RNA-directed DNA polymerase [Synechocystis salina LEGE 06155]
MQDSHFLDFALTQSDLFKLSSLQTLANILGTDEQTLKKISGNKKKYKQKEAENKNNKTRLIEIPIPPLKKIQKRISDLLHQIDKPDYLYCPARGKPVFDNVKAHLGQREIQKLDIQSYFQSTNRKRVYYFFFDVMKCSKEVANLLTSLVTFKDHLPTGAPSSPLLSYFVHYKMWSEIYFQVSEAHCIMTLYMDDLFISGQKIPKGFIWKIQKIIHKYNLKSHKNKRVVEGPIEITGIIINKNHLDLPKRKHKDRAVNRRKLNQTNDVKQIEFLRKQFNGYQAESKKLESINSKNYT